MAFTAALPCNVGAGKRRKTLVAISTEVHAPVISASSLAGKRRKTDRGKLEPGRKRHKIDMADASQALMGILQLRL